MHILIDQIQKAEQRLDFDPRALRESWRDHTPRDRVSTAQCQHRRSFLRESLQDKQQADAMLERILDGNELVGVNYLARGAAAARAVARIRIVKQPGRTFGWGTGFLIAPNVLITNHHVLEEPGDAIHSEAHLEYELAMDDLELGPIRFQLQPERLFYTVPELDFTIVAVSNVAMDQQRPLSEFGVLPLLGASGKAMEGEWLTIIQHPSGQRKQVCVRENRLLKRADDVLWYSTDTLGGSSGSPVFNNDWYVVALHHSGVPEKRDGVIQTVDGRDYDPNRMDETQIKWLANEGIRASRIVETLKQHRSNEPLLQPMFAVGPTAARVEDHPAVPAQTPSSMISTRIPMNNPMPGMPITLPATITFTLPSTGPLAAMPAGTMEAAILEEARRRRTQRRKPVIPSDFDPTYKDRKGYDEDFLGEDYRVPLPTLSDALEEDAAPLLKPTASNKYILHYHHFSLVMSKSRRFGIYSAANVNFGQRWDLGDRSDNWIADPRISRQHQYQNSLYLNNQFDRGHLTRHKDVKWGTTASLALAAVEDSCHYTNAVPMHSQFNQEGDDTPLWYELEQYILENSIDKHGFRAQVITGPILMDDDPEYKGVQYPLEFWKVVAAVNASDELFATGYLLSQKKMIDKFGIERAPEIPFGAFETYQRKIVEIEKLTGLRFTYGKTGKPLSDKDPLRNSSPRRRRRGDDGDAPLDGPESIIL